MNVPTLQPTVQGVRARSLRLALLLLGWLNDLGTAATAWRGC